MIYHKPIDLGPSNKVLVFADLHAHEYKPFNTTTTEGIGSRFQWILKALGTMVNYAKEQNIKHIFCLGDVFHHRTLMQTIVFDKVVEILDSEYPDIMDIVKQNSTNSMVNSYYANQYLMDWVLPSNLRFFSFVDEKAVNLSTWYTSEVWNRIGLCEA